MIENNIASATSASSSTLVAGLYAGLLGRVADPAGLAYWAQQLDAGLSFEAVTRAILGGSEGTQLFGDGSSAAFVTAIYQSAFGRAPDPAGLAYWTQALAQGGGDSDAARAHLVSQMLEPILSGPATSADQQVFTNRADASLYFAQTAGFTITPEQAHDVLANVTSDPATLTSFKDETDHGSLGQPAPTPTPDPTPAPDPTPDPTPAHTTAAIDFTPNVGTAEGSSDASAALALGGNTMLVGDDEANVLRVYSRDGGAALKEISYDSYLGSLGEADLEASARIGDTLYFIGSHSNNKSGVDQNSREVIFSATVSGSGAATELTFTGKFLGMESVLTAWDHSNAHGLGVDHFGMLANAASGAPEKDAGFSIEGLTFSPDDSAMWLGFRAPVTGGNSLHEALIVPVINYDAVLTSGATPVLGDAIQLDLGGRGIRSIDKSADGQYIVLAGPAGPASADVPDDFRLYTWDGSVDGTGQAIHLVQRAANLDALLATTGGSFESVVEVPGSLTDTTWIQLLQDNGDTVWSGQSQASKDLPAAQQHFNGNWIQLGAPVAADATAPQLVRSTPAHNATNVSSTAKVVLTFDEAVHAGGAGSFVLKAGGTTVQTLAATDSHMTYEYNSVTIDTSGLLSGGQTYSLEVANGAIVDASGNAFAGLDTAHAVDFTTAAVGTSLSTGDIAFVGFNAKATNGAADAFAFVLLKDVVAGTSIHFTDKEWDGTAFNSGESDLLWTATGSLTAGTVITIQPGLATPLASSGTLTGSGGGLGDGGEQVFAFTGTVASPGTFLSAIGMGTPNGGLVTSGADLNNTSLVPAGLTLGDTAVNLAFVNAKYTGATTGTVDELRASIETAANWTTANAAGNTITGNKLDLGFTDLTVQDPNAPTALAAGDVVFLGINTDSTDAFAFMVMKSVTAGTQIGFTDRDYSLTTGIPSTGEGVYVWTAGQAVAAGTIITIQPDVASSTNPIASIGTMLGKGGGLSASGETVYAFQGTVDGLATGTAGAITPTTWLGGINAGGAAAGDTPAGLTLPTFNGDNAVYTGSRDATDVTALQALVLDATNWSVSDSTPVALVGNNFFA